MSMRINWANMAIVIIGTLIVVAVCRGVFGLSFWVTQAIMIPMGFASGAIVPIIRRPK